MYVNFIFISVFIGYVVAVAPIVSFNFGAQNHKELRNVFKKSLVIIGIMSLAMFLVSEILSVPMASIFVRYDEVTKNETIRAFLIYSFSFLFMGYAIFNSGFFTALSNGLISAAISFLRTLVIQVAAVLVLPIFFGIDGIWYSLVVAELLAMMFSFAFLLLKRRRYNY